MLRSLKKSDIRTPDGDTGFWVMEQKAGQRQLAGRQFARAARRAADVHLPTGFARGQRHPVFPLAPAALRHREIPRRRPAAPRPQRQPGLQGNRPAWRRDETAGARRSRARASWPEACILYSHDNDWTLQQPNAAEQVFQPARAHPAFLQRAPRPEHPGGFRPADGGPVEIQARVRALAASAVGRRGRPAEALRPERRHAGRHLQHRPGGRAPHRARHRLPARPDRSVRPGSAGIRPVAARRGKPSHLQRHVPGQPSASGPALVRHHRAEGLPGAGHLREGFLCRAGPP